MAARSAFSYAIVRVVPSIERGERLNVGVVLHCRERRFLAARVGLDERRLEALAPDLDPGTVRRQLDAIVAIAAGEADGDPVASLPAPERFGHLVAPSSTIVQPSSVHTGLCEDPAATLDELFAELVA